MLDETRGAGWEFLYVAVDNHSRIAFTAILPDEKAASSCRLLPQAVAYFARLVILGRRVMPDNGPCFYAKHFACTCHKIQLKHIRTRIYRNSSERLSHLAPWTHLYNWHRPHAGLNQKPPITRSGLNVNNLLRHRS
jgi:transposase InsO family protein